MWKFLTLISTPRFINVLHFHTGSFFFHTSPQNGSFFSTPLLKPLRVEPPKSASNHPLILGFFGNGRSERFARNVPQATFLS